MSIRRLSATGSSFLTVFVYPSPLPMCTHLRKQRSTERLDIIHRCFTTTFLNRAQTVRDTRRQISTDPESEISVIVHLNRLEPSRVIWISIYAPRVFFNPICQFNKPLEVLRTPNSRRLLIYQFGVGLASWHKDRVPSVDQYHLLEFIKIFSIAILKSEINFLRHNEHFVAKSSLNVSCKPILRTVFVSL